jgi:hypothetical protein
MVKVVEHLISKFKVVGSTPTTLVEIFYFLLLKFFIFCIHIFIIFSIHDVSPAVVEACLKNSYCSIAQSKGTPWCSVIPGFEPMPMLGPTLEIKLCMV